AFRIRIEMRQIGMRQEASRLGGIGSCGRELCCSTWLTDFKTVSTSAARYQNLSLNTLKLAGQCGKLKCCLNYELDSYMDALKDIANDVNRIETQYGVAFLQKTDIFKKTMWFSFPGAENWIPLDIAKVKEFAEMNKGGVKPENLGYVAPEEEPKKSVVYDYENVVGQDSLTRLDEKNRRKKKRKGKPKSGTANSTKSTAEKASNTDKPDPTKATGPRKQAPKAVQADQGGSAQHTPSGEPRKKKRFNYPNKNRPEGGARKDQAPGDNAG